MDHSSHAGHIGQAATPAPLVGGHGSMHSMAFHFGSMETILFNFWMPMSTGGMIVSCLIVVAMCFFMEMLRFLRTYRAAQRPPSMENQIRFEPTVTGYVLMDGMMHFVQLAISYCLMLIFMTFNVWLCLAVLIGEVGSRLFFNILFPGLMESANVGHC
ncbi:unnamed protein product [Cylicocyclus nassatus]|uniref:Copper transport protein n=1 Tax=Cylicocyclus nassatus TaxID=53992 RepID=A0AA36HBY8_CYLNA|nr:unnamed protein product [Cylicocyclus nassatus]